MIALKKGTTPDWVVTNQAEETAKYVAWAERADDVGTKNAGTEPSPWRREDIKDALIVESNHGKCVYCESRMLHVTFGDVEHYKPKSRFPEDVLRWENLGLSCSKCNNEKLAQWSDHAPIVWPYQDDPNEHFSFLGTFLQAKTPRGRNTLKHVRLNDRVELIEERDGLLRRLERDLEMLARTRPGHTEITQRAIRESYTARQEYFAFANAYLTEKGITGPTDRALATPEVVAIKTENT
jgi:uncharacterized protein (TIGR02646 family)